MKLLLFIIAFVMATSLAPAQTTLSSAEKRKAKAVAIFAPRPYPVDAQGRRPIGHGIIVVEINRETGWVISAKMEKNTGNKLLDDATIEAFSRWRFKPGIVRYVRSDHVHGSTVEWG